MDSNLQTKINAVIEAEGGDKYTNDPLDKGGPTKFGITEVTARAFGYNGDIKEMDRSTAERIYAARYWHSPRFDQVNLISVQLAFLMFDWGVTSGPSTAAKALQRSLNVLNSNGGDYPDVSADGAIGPMTIQCLRQFVLKRGSIGLKYLVGMVAALRRVQYIEIAERNPTQERFENGWQARAFNSEL